MDFDQLDGFITRQEAAVMLGVHPNTLTNWLSNRTRDDRPKPVQVGPMRLYRRSDVEAYQRRIAGFGR